VGRRDGLKNPTADSVATSILRDFSFSESSDEETSHFHKAQTTKTVSTTAGEVASSPKISFHNRCRWNQSPSSKRKCKGSAIALSQNDGVCESCKTVRERWTARLVAEFPAALSRSQIRHILDKHMDLNVCRKILEDRVCAGKTRREADAQSEERRESGRGGGGGRAGSQQANNENISWNGNFSGKREEEKRHVVARRGEDADSSTEQQRGAAFSEEEEEERISKASKLGRESQRLRDQREEEDRGEGVCDLNLPPLASPAPSSRNPLASPAPSAHFDLLESPPQQLPIPSGFFLTGFTGKEIPEDVCEGSQVSCWQCGATQIVERANVAALIIGGNTVQSRTNAVNVFGGLPAVCMLNCSTPDCCVGRSEALIALLWEGKWQSVDDFLTIAGGGDEYIEVPCGLSRERIILHILHWFSKTKQAATDRHACFLPPPLDRSCAIVCRNNVACAYSTYTLDASNGWLLPTLHTIFVKASHRRMGCASQLLRGFFRPEERGRHRMRQSDNKRSLQPILLDSSCLDFSDKLGIEPPVSDDLILTMAAIFSTNELRNIILLHSDQTLQVARAKAKTMLDHMRAPKVLKNADANTPLRRIRGGREGRLPQGRK